MQHPVVQITRISNGSAVLRIFGINGLDYLLQTTDEVNGGDWQTLSVLSGENEFIDDTITENSIRFYRVIPKHPQEWVDLPTSSEF